jgi:hypothetical protein
LANLEPFLLVAGFLREPHVHHKSNCWRIRSLDAITSGEALAGTCPLDVKAAVPRPAR